MDIFGNTGSDTLRGTSGQDYIYGYAQGTDPVLETGNDSLSGGGGSDQIRGGGGNDIIFGDEGSDFLFGELGNDSLYGGIGSDAIEGGAGNDFMSGEDGDDQFIDDELTQSAAGNDTVYGGLGNDFITSRSGNDSLFGGDGTDRLVLARSAATTATTLTGSGTTANFGLTTINGIELIQIFGGTAGDTYDGSIFAGVTFYGNAGADRLTGGAGNDQLYGGTEADTLFGGAGNDSLDGGAGTDSMTGGLGNDRYVVDVSTDVVIETNADLAEIDSVQSAVTFSLATLGNVENLELIGTATATATGNDRANILTGNEVENSLIGNGGDDILNGGYSADSMNGGAGNDTYYVDNPLDVTTEAGISAGEVDSVISSNNFVLGTNVENLTLTGGNALTGTGNASNNILVGNNGANTLTGLGGNDSLDGGLGADSMAGGAGSDSYTVDNLGDIVTEANTPGEIDSVTTSVAFSLLGTNIENLTLVTAYRQPVVLNGIGNASNNTITGNLGNNSLVGDAGADSLLGGIGNDSLDGGTGADTMRGGSGNDIYIVDSSADIVSETIMVGTPAVAKDEGGTDRVESTATFTLGNFFENLTLTGNLSINGTGNALNNILIGNGASNTLTGDAGNDSLNGGLGADLLRGGAGNDTYTVDDLGDVVTEIGASGADEGGTADLVVSTVNFTLADYLENLTLDGTAETGIGNGARNKLNGNAASNTLWGEAGTDTLNGGLGKDTLYGGAGDDSYIIDDAGDLATEASTQGVDDGGIDQVTSSVSVTIGEFVEKLFLVSGTAAINGTGNAQNNTLTGNSGVNVLTGGDGNDTLIGNIGNDTLNGDGGNDSLTGGVGNDDMRGGAGSDSYSVDSTFDTVSEINDTGIDSVTSSVSFTLGSFVENLTLTLTGALSGTGNSGNNILIGNSGSNALTGLGGNDTLDGAAGRDVMQGGGGNDIYKVDLATDQVSESTNGTTDDGGTDTVITTVTYTLTNFVENLTLDRSSPISGTGNVLNNRLLGNSGSNTLSGLGGDDRIDGGGGADRMLGGAGNDAYLVDSLSDQVIESTNGTADDGGMDRVESTVTHTLANFVENLMLTGTRSAHGTGNGSNNSLTGNGAANSLTGLAGNDTLTGNGGADVLDGGAGSDRLIGGTGADRFVFNSSSGVDTVAGFVTRSDTLVFNDDAFVAIRDLDNNGRVDASQFVLGTAAKDANDVLIYDKALGKLYYDSNGSAAGNKVEIVTFSAGTTLALSDLFVI